MRVLTSRPLANSTLTAASRPWRVVWTITRCTVPLLTDAFTWASILAIARAETCARRECSAGASAVLRSRVSSCAMTALCSCSAGCVAPALCGISTTGTEIATDGAAVLCRETRSAGGAIDRSRPSPLEDAARYAVISTIVSDVSRSAVDAFDNAGALTLTALAVKTPIAHRVPSERTSSPRVIIMLPTWLSGFRHQPQTRLRLRSPQSKATATRALGE